ncbi:lipase [Hysterangium stoloniferum]|nr:lipase [Hysterangium stoloniferum]
MLHLLCLGFALLPLSSAVILPRQGIVTELSSAEINTFTPFTYFASVAYCHPDATLQWSCGAKCNANPDFIPVASGGDGDQNQFWYVGFDPTLNTVVVGHHGLNLRKILADITVLNVFLTPLNQTLFPGTSGLKVHSGFATFQARSAPGVLSAVQTALVKYNTANTTSVTIVGHSLGAAIGLIDAVYLPLHLPSTIKFRFIGYGMPRVGNPAFANYLDKNFPDLTHINNKKDSVPIIPMKWLGYQHPHGEIHIQDNGAWDACAGNDNNSKLCSTGYVPNILEGNTNDHNGPYNGIMMGCL